MFDENERLAIQEAHWLVKEFGAEAPLYAAMKAEKAIERILEILADSPAAKSAGSKY